MAVSVDGLGQDPGSRDAARSLAQQAAWPFPVRLATDQAIEQLTALDNATFYFQLPLPVPTSFLLDRQGNVAAIYKGAVTSEQVMKDARLLEAPLRNSSRRPLFSRAATAFGIFSCTPSTLLPRTSRASTLTTPNLTSSSSSRNARRTIYEIRLRTPRPATWRSCVPTKCWWPLPDWQENRRTRLRPTTNWNASRRCLRRWLLAWHCSWQAKSSWRRPHGVSPRLPTANADSAAVLDLVGSTYLRLGATPLRHRGLSSRRPAGRNERDVPFQSGHRAAGGGRCGRCHRGIRATFSRNSRRWLRPPTTSLGSLPAIRTNRFASPEKARQLAELACQKTNYQEPAYLDTLAVAAAAEGDFDTAIKHGAAGGRALRCQKKRRPHSECGSESAATGRVFPTSRRDARLLQTMGPSKPDKMPATDADD